MNTAIANKKTMMGLNLKILNVRLDIKVKKILKSPFYVRNSS